jgi:hypothetical protein
MAMKQTSFSSVESAAKKQITRRVQFSADMEQVVPWTELGAVLGMVLCGNIHRRILDNSGNFYGES